MNIECSFVQLNNLPDEILLMIFKKLNSVALLNSLFGVNRRFNQILHDQIFLSHLTLLEYYSNGFICQLPSPTLNRFCVEILPKIHDKIIWLNLESISMERILRAANYPNLSVLGLYEIGHGTAIDLLSGDNPLTHYKNQISSLVIDIVKSENQYLGEDVYNSIFTNIFTVFSKLKYLNFCPSSYFYQQLSFDSSSPTVFSSSLLELHINLELFTDCLYMLDGRFNQLRTFSVNLNCIVSPTVTIPNQPKLPKLRCFALYCDMTTDGYDQLVLPLLRRMLNLEEFALYLKVFIKNTFIDGNNLKENIVNNMPRLTKFMFNIYSKTNLYNQTSFPSNEDIRQTFKGFMNKKIMSCVDYFPGENEGRCHIYTCPYRLKVYDNITNNFPGGFFQYVHQISLFDERPFEYEFFLRISQAFPFIKKLSLKNNMPQNDKQLRKTRNINGDLSIIKYPHLIELDLIHVHEDYAEHFLKNNEVYLPDNLFLRIKCGTLHKVTGQFTKDTTRINCAKLARIYFFDQSTFIEHLNYDFFQSVKNYCPNTKIY